MRLSSSFIKTLKDAPKDEVSKNAQLLIRAGYVHKEMAGVYAYLPLGLRVLEKIKQIVREEMNAIGGEELIMTALQRKELWEQTDRWDDETVDVWFKSKLKNGTEVGFGWSHEEPISSMMKNYISSYKDLPALVYQFQTKLRNELRAKSGIMRGREFIMKDMYSYARNEEEHQKIYDATIAAYMNVYDRVGLGDLTSVTFATGGAFTQFSHEFQTLSDAGEDVVFRVPSTGNMFNQEIAPSKAPSVAADQPQEAIEEVKGEGIIGVGPLAQFLKIPIEQTTKTMIFSAEDGTVIAAAVRGGYDINLDKLVAVAGKGPLQLASEETVKKVTGAAVGYAGIIGLPDDVLIFVDESCEHRVNFEMGANKTDFHSINVNWDKDIAKPDTFYDIKLAKKGDLYPESDEEYDVVKAAEVGNIFNFGTIKSEQLGLSYNNDDGKVIPVHLGSYGLGITRLMGVLVEVFGDSKGLVWPKVVAPYDVHVVQIGDDERVIAEITDIEAALHAVGVECLIDDRDERVGSKLSDAELIGMPEIIVIGARSIEKGRHELTDRATGATQELTKKEIIDHFTAA